MPTFGTFKSDIRKRLWPAGEPPQLVAAHDKAFVDALIDLQTVVECLQSDNTNIVPQCATFYDCQMTVFQAPRGNIKSVSVIDKIGASASGTITASKAGDIITSSAPFFDASMIGNLIVFPDGQSFVITAFISTTQVVVQTAPPTAPTAGPALQGHGPPQGQGPPIDPPATTTAIYFDLDTGTQYNYYAGAWH